jgi:hypothetical protein
MSDGTGRKSLSRVGVKGRTAFVPFVDNVAPTFLVDGFFTRTFFFNEALLFFDFFEVALVVAIVSPLP